MVDFQATAQIGPHLGVPVYPCLLLAMRWPRRPIESAPEN